MRAPVNRSRSRGLRAASRAGQWLTIIALLVSLLAPLIPAAPLAAAQPGSPFPPPLPAPTRVALSGSFQTALGCPADFDPTCPQTQLEENGDGSWSAALPIPPGDYVFRVVATSDAERALGEGGDPNGADLPLSVPADAAGAYFRYDSLTGEIVAEPVNALASLVTDLGEEYAMAPTAGGYEVTWDARPGNYGVQILLNGEVVTQDSVSLDRPERVIVAVDPSGAVTTKTTLQETRLDVAAIDMDGNPRPGSCFAIIDRANQLRAQACDEDDGQRDGMVALRVPNGLDDGQYTLRETATAEGAPAAADQTIQLGRGRFEATAQAASGAAAQPATEQPDTEPATEAPGIEPATEAPATETPVIEVPAGQPVMQPGEQPGRLTVVAVDAAGQPIPGACFALIEFGFELCDDDFDGTVIFDSVPSVLLTLRETTPPAGYMQAADLPITIQPTGARLLVPHEQSATEAPAVEETATPATEAAETPPVQPVETTAPAVSASQVTLLIQDQAGQPVAGACWMLTERQSGASAERCDSDDGSDDGTIVFEGVAAGRYRFDETVTPQGFQPAESGILDVPGDAPVRATIEYRAGRDETAPGRLVIDVADEDGAPLPGSCFELRGPVDLAEFCDQQNDGRLNVPDLPPGDYTVTQTRGGEGFVPAGETAVTVPAGETVELPLVNEREDAAAEQTVPADRGRVIVNVRQEDGSPVADACVTLRGDTTELSACNDAEGDESAEPGQIEVADVPAGNYTLTVLPPGDLEAPEPTTIQVVSGQPTTVDVAIAAPPPVAENGRLAIRAEDDAGNALPGACYIVEIPPGGQGFGPFCDEDGNGEVTIDGVTPGPIAVIEATSPAESEASPQTSQTVDIVAGEETAVVFTHAATAQPQSAQGSVAVRIVGPEDQPVAACVTISGEAESFNVCDNDRQDRDEQSGSLLIAEVIPGAYTLSLSDLPAGVVAPEAQQIEVVAGETSPVEFVTEAGFGTLVLFVEDEQGQPLGGSCFTLERGEESIPDICDQGDDGRLNIPDLPPGEYTIVQTRSGVDRDLAPVQTATVAAGQTTEVRLVNPRAALPETPTPQPTATMTPAPEETATQIPSPTAAPTTPSPSPTATAEATTEPVATAGQPAAGTLAVVNLAPDSTLLGGGCFSVTDTTGAVIAARCDNGQDDFDNTPGVIAFGALPAGNYTVTQTQAPTGYSAAAPLQIEHGAQPQTIDIVSDVAAAETGTVELAAFDDDGNPIPGQCYTLSGIAGSFGPFCDDGEGDTSGEPGVLVVEGLPTGTYEAVLETAPEEPEAELAQQAKPRRSVSVLQGRRPTRARFTVRAQQNRRGDLLIRVRDQDGRYLGGACFALTPNGETAPSAEVCDNQRDDQNSSNGRILLTNLRTGRYTVSQTTAPAGYTPAGEQTVRIQAGSVRELAFTNALAREQTATLDVVTVDRQGNRLPGACYALVIGNRSTEACDADTGDDGVTRFTDVEAGSYVVRQIQPPAGGYTAAGATATLIEAGQSATVTIVNEPRPGSLLIRKTDEGGRLLAGSCFALIQENRNRYRVCDNDASDGNQGDGVILLATIAPGDYTLRETRAPAGFLAAADQEVTIAANQRTQVSVANAAAPPPERVGDLRVFKIDPRGRALAGSCFALIDTNGQIVHPTCDADDGADNGVVLLEDVAIGDYTLRETRRPSADYELAADRAVTIVENQTVDVEIENRLRTGRIVIRKTDPNGRPLADACFDVVEDAAGASCTNENGELVFSGLVPGVYQVIETETPAGYLATPQIDPITVRPGSTATVDVVNEPAPPPPDSGSLQVVKFLCPATAGNGGIAFVDSSDPDGGGLARTAGCDPGDAAFALDGPSGPIEFRTGARGRYQTTLPTGDYVLTELASGASEPLVVTVNTLTTVVVVNYIEPEPEAPAAIEVIKYTCDPGFQGRVWADFADGCLSEENLTNNISFRISGTVSARRVTGDTGVGGTTRFEALPAGDYRLREEAPTGTVAIYAFCGVDPNAPDGRAVGDTLALRLTPGQTVTCTWFNVPEDLAGNTGAITVYKYACPVTTPSATFDWYGRCDPQGQGVRFSLSLWDGAAFTPVTVAATDNDGILRLTRLQPGIYDLKEVDAAWCRAESDSVNQDGHVVVEAGKRASVWIFNCVGAKNPPNTGAGPMWSLGPALPPAISTTGVGLSLLWPLVGLAALRRRRAA